MPNPQPPSTELSEEWERSWDSGETPEWQSREDADLHHLDHSALCLKRAERKKRKFGSVWIIALSILTLQLQLAIILVFSCREAATAAPSLERTRKTDRALWQIAREKNRYLASAGRCLFSSGMLSLVESSSGRFSLAIPPSPVELWEEKARLPSAARILPLGGEEDVLQDILKLTEKA